jgi:hypothetical protein
VKSINIETAPRRGRWTSIFITEPGRSSSSSRSATTFPGSNRLIYTFNGRAIRAIETGFPSVPVDVRFSSAIADFEGHTYEGHDEDPARTEMDVAWVRAAPLKR